MNKMKILIVEDEGITALDIKGRLQDLGYKVPAIADSGAEAIALADKFKPDLILMDIVLKGKMDGTQAAQAITEKLQLPIIFLTAYSDAETFKRAKVSGPYGYLTKPFETRDLRNAIELALYKSEMVIKLAESELRFHNAFDYAAIGMTLVNPERKFLQINQAFSSMLGYSKEELLTLSLNDITHPADLETEYNNIQQLLRHELVAVQFEKRYKHKLGQIITTLVNVSLVENNKGTPLYFIYQVQDISALKLSENKLLHLTQHDALTGLAKRNLLEDFINNSLVTARKHEKKIAIFFLNLNQFKRINDTLGYEAGDRLLHAVSERLRQNINASDFVAKLGSDEFVLIKTNINKMESAIATAQKIKGTFIKPFLLNNQEFHITTSMGISLYPNDGDDAATLIKNADIALHRARLQGNNNYQFFTQEMTTLTQARVDLENRLHEGLVNHEFLYYYQPKVDLSSGKISSVEALLRWQQPKSEPMLPRDLISIAEETGLIVPLSIQMLRSACQQANKWQAAGFKSMSIAINLSARQFYETDIIETFASILKEAKCTPAHLELEITESMLMRDVKLSKKVLKSFKDLGFKLTIDDFGTGYCSFNYLQFFPLDKLKIDQTFVRDIATNARSAAIVKGIILLAQALDLKVIAEGVETLEQLQLLREYGCDEIQGYYFSRPVSAEAMTQLLEEDRHLSI